MDLVNLVKVLGLVICSLSLSFSEKYLVPLKQSIRSSILGNGNMYLIFIFFIALESVHVL